MKIEDFLNGDGKGVELMKMIEQKKGEKKGRG